MKKKITKSGSKDGNVVQYCFQKSGKFKNGSIHSFRQIRGGDEYKANKDCTHYGPYYQGESWDINFAELFTDSSMEIYCVIDNQGNKLKLGDYSTSITGTQMMITKFYISNQEINYSGIEMRQTLGILGNKTFFKGNSY